MYVTTDAVAVSCSPEEGLRVVLVRRGNPPFVGRWALPGGFVDPEEDLPDGCTRELAEETGLKAAQLVQIGAWGEPGRDPRGRNVSVAYLALVRSDSAELRAGDDAAAADWHRASQLPRLAFDHALIVAAGLEKLRSLAGGTHVIFGLLPEEFRMDQLRDALSRVRGELVTEQEALAFAKTARVVRLAGATSREGDRFRCAATDLLTPLR
jgi:8-oxo-dGTP diphosphatase